MGLDDVGAVAAVADHHRLQAIVVDRAVVTRTVPDAPLSPALRAEGASGSSRRVASRRAPRILSGRRRAHRRATRMSTRPGRVPSEPAHQHREAIQELEARSGVRPDEHDGHLGTGAPERSGDRHRPRRRAPSLVGLRLLVGFVAGLGIRIPPLILRRAGRSRSTGRPWRLAVGEHRHATHASSGGAPLTASPGPVRAIRPWRRTGRSPCRGPRFAEGLADVVLHPFGTSR